MDRTEILRIVTLALALTPGPGRSRGATAEPLQAPASPATATAAAGAPEDPEVEAASRAVRQGRPEEAAVILRKAAGKHPEWPPVRLIVARMHFTSNQSQQGRRALEQAAAEAPDHPSIYLTFLSLALAEGRYSDARLNGEKALTLVDNGKLLAANVGTARREAHAGLAASAEGRNDWSTADAQLRAWLADDPTNGPARQRLGRVRLRLGKPEQAFEEFKQAVKNDPRLEPAAVSMALLHAQAGNVAKAAEWFAYAAKAGPKSAAVRLAHARWLLGQGKPSEALPLIEEAARLDPESKEVGPLRGLVAWQHRDLPTAERIFEGILRAAPGDASTANMLALTLVEQDDPAKKSRGLQLAEANVRQFPKSADALSTLGRAHDRAGHLEEAARTLQAAVSGGQASVDTAYFLARVLAEKGQHGEARALLTAAVAIPGAFVYREEAKKLLAGLPASDKPEAGAAGPIPSPER